MITLIVGTGSIGVIYGLAGTMHMASQLSRYKNRKRPIDRTDAATVDTPVRRSKTIFHRLAGGVLALFTWALATLLALVAALLVLLSLRWGPTHWAVALLLAAVWVGLVGLLVLAIARFHSRQIFYAATLGFLLLSLTTVAASQISAYTPPILDAQGTPIPGSIASLEKVNLNGSDQWISIRGKSIDKPVLLFLAGGPGGSQLATARHALGGLEDHFVVVNWEQPGAGKSFDAVARSTLTPGRYVEDGHALVVYLKQRFNQSKLYVVGESWGSALGIMLVQRYPELFHAFVGTGQMVAFTATDRMDYAFALRWAQERGDTAKLEKLKAQGPPPYYGDGVAWKQATYLLDTFAYMNQNSAIYASDDNTIRDILSPEYGLYDKVNWVRGLLDTLNVVYPQLWDVDFRTQATRLEVPVYFLIGRHDINAPVVLTQEYEQVLQAPHKEIIWFEHSGHTPWTREPGRFVEVLVNQVLKQTQPTR